MARRGEERKGMVQRAEAKGEETRGGIQEVLIFFFEEEGANQEGWSLLGLGVWLKSRIEAEPPTPAPIIILRGLDPPPPPNSVLIGFEVEVRSGRKVEYYLGVTLLGFEVEVCGGRKV